ncbi:hypothetical protein M405DRAFT_862282 [Rhizopogon salebrosus TDB-379]|nr:hypothetical protein M405DRAFT_862282 [Rhizopogon salebrosus TDB-379]
MSHLASLANSANSSTLPLDILKTALERWNCPGEDLERCARILYALQNPPAGMIMLSDVTCGEYASVLGILMEERHLQFIARGTYFEDTEELVIMAPNDIQSLLISDLRAYVNSFLHDMKLDWHTARVDALSYLPSMSPFGIFPEMQVVVSDFWRNDPDRDSKSKWVCECGLSSDEEIGQMYGCPGTNRSRSGDLHIGQLEEQLGMVPPEEDADSAIALRSRPRMEYKDFYAAAAGGNYLGRLSSRALTDGNFDLDNRDPVCFAKGTLYPTMHMDDIMCKLQLGAQRLKESIISVMEEMGEEEFKLQGVRDSKPELEPGHWDVLLAWLRPEVVSTA